MRAFLLFPLVLAACVAPDERARERDEAELASELEGRSAGQTEQCVPTRMGEGLVARDRRTLVYRSGDTLWVNRLEADCPGLDPPVTVMVEVHGSSYCRNDRVRAVEPGSSVPGPWCRLGDFVPWRR